MHTVHAEPPYLVASNLCRLVGELCWQQWGSDAGGPVFVSTGETGTGFSDSTCSIRKTVFINHRLEKNKKPSLHRFTETGHRSVIFFDNK